MGAEAQMNAPLDLGAWQNDRQLLAKAPLSLYGDVDQLPDAVRFQVYVSRLVQLREQHLNAETAGAAAFVLVTAEYQRQQGIRLGCGVDRTVHTGKVRLAGRVHFMTCQAKSSVYEEHTGDANALYSRLEELQCAHQPALVYDPGEGDSTLSYYPLGTYTDDGMIAISLKGNPVGEGEILEAIEAVYRAELCTPDNTGPTKIWQDAFKWWPVNEAERTVQQFVRAGLAGRFHWCTIRAEQPGKFGRTDLEIVNDRNGPPGSNTHHAVLELKVLRSFTHTGNRYSPASNDDAIKKGVIQANSYGNATNSSLRMLCCFDMREKDVGDDATFSPVCADAIAFRVSLKRWYMYRSSDEMREALARRQLKVTSDAKTGQLGIFSPEVGAAPTT